MSKTKNLGLKDIPTGTTNYKADNLANLEKIDALGNGLTSPTSAGGRTTINGYSTDGRKIPLLKITPRDDGTFLIELARAGDTLKIKNVVYSQATSTSVAGDWASGISYELGERVRHHGLLFQVTQAHISTTFSADLEFWVCVSLGAEIVSQANTFSQFAAIRNDGASWVTAQANSASTLSDPPSIVIERNPNYFLYSMTGIIQVDNAFTPGSVYFVSDTVPGAISTTIPATFSNPVLKCLSADAVMILPYRPTEA